MSPGGTTRRSARHGKRSSTEVVIEGEGTDVNGKEKETATEDLPAIDEAKNGSGEDDDADEEPSDSDFERDPEQSIPKTKKKPTSKSKKPKPPKISDEANASEDEARYAVI
jgi:hypothetical protein